MEDKKTHATPEMSALILEIEEARKKDTEMIQKHQAHRNREKREWKAKTTQEQNELIRKGMGYKPNDGKISSKWVRAIRRKIRYRIFRIREGKEQYDKGLKAWFELQFTEDMNWGNFTFDWDVSPSDPLKVITPMEWVSSGGDLVTLPGSKVRNCDPPAFTRQEI